MNIGRIRNLPLSENIATKFTAIPMYTWNTSEQVVFCPSRVSKPRAIGVRSWFTLWRSNWNLRQSGPGSRYFRIDFVWFHSAMGSLHRNEKNSLQLYQIWQSLMPDSVELGGGSERYCERELRTMRSVLPRQPGCHADLFLSWALPSDDVLHNYYVKSKWLWPRR